MLSLFTNAYTLVLTAMDRSDDEGAAAAEYGLLIALIAVVIIGVVTTLGTDIQAAFQKVVNAI